MCGNLQFKWPCSLFHAPAFTSDIQSSCCRVQQLHKQPNMRPTTRNTVDRLDKPSSYAASKVSILSF